MKKIVLIVLFFCLLAGCGEKNKTDVMPTNTPTMALTEEDMATPVPTNTPVPSATHTPIPEPTATSTPIPTPTEVPHEHVWELVITEATCIADGRTVEVCECGEIQNDTMIPAIGHVWTAKEMIATCTEAGKTWDECVCGEIQNEVIVPATGHLEHTYHVTINPSVAEDGKYENVCNACGTVVDSGSIPKLTPTPTPTPTNTPTPTPTPKPTATPTPSPSPTPKYTFKDFEKTMYAKSSVNVRDLPSTEGGKIGSLNDWEKVTVTGQCKETNWYKINFNGLEGFVSSNYLVDNKPTPTPTPIGVIVDSGTSYGIEWTLDSNGRLELTGVMDELPEENEWGFTQDPDWIWTTLTYQYDIYSVYADCVMNTTCRGLFGGLVRARTIEFGPNFDTSNVSDMACMFYNCSGVEQLDIVRINTSKVTNMQGMFTDCDSLVELDTTGWDTSNVTDMSSMFAGCDNLANLNISGLDTSKVTDMSGMFSRLDTLEVLDLSTLDTSNVTDMGSMFNWCLSLKQLDLSNFDTSKVKDMGFMFCYAKDLELLNVSSFDTSQVKDMEHMFSGCYCLKKLDISNFKTPNVKDMSNLFNGLNNVIEIVVSQFNTTNVIKMESMFAGCNNLVELDLSSFDTSQVTTMSGMFDGCSSLKALDLSSFNTTKVTSMRRMFRDCSSLTNLALAHFDVSQVTNMREMFSGCTALSTLNLGNWNTSNVYYRYNIFNKCNSLVNIPKIKDYAEIRVNTQEENMKEYGTPDPNYPVMVDEWTLQEGIKLRFWREDVSEEELKGARFGTLMEILGEGELSTIVKDYCNSVKEKYDNNTLRTFFNQTDVIIVGEGITIIHDRVFESCTEKTLILPSTLKEIGVESFYYNRYLVEINLPEGVEKVEEEAFWHCYSVGKIIMPSTLKYIGDWAFAKATTYFGEYEVGIIDEIELPKNLEYLGEYAFGNRTQIVIYYNKKHNISKLKKGWDSTAILVENK